MKTLTKIIILLAAVVLAVGGIIVYAETRANSPTVPKEINVYTQDLRACEATIKSSTTKASLQGKADEAFDMTVDRINVFYSEHKIEDYDVNDHLALAFDNYMPIYLSYCFGKFKQSEWHKNELSEIQRRNKDLMNVKRTDGASAISATDRDSLKVIDETISAYSDALSISRNPKFTDVASAKTKIKSANAYLNHKYLRNCTSLVNDLREVPRKISRSQYNDDVKKKVDLLKQPNLYKIYTSVTYKNKYLNPADEAIKNYEEMSKLYGDVSLSMSQFKMDLGTARKESETYYKNHPYMNN